jgi:hypothetical protein
VTFLDVIPPAPVNQQEFDAKVKEIREQLEKQEGQPDGEEAQVS